MPAHLAVDEHVGGSQPRARVYRGRSDVVGVDMRYQLTMHDTAKVGITTTSA